MKLTRAQQDTLRCCPDWSAPFEVAKRRQDQGVCVYSLGARRMLRKLLALGLVQYGVGNDTYRITEAGREALHPKGESRE